MSTSQRTHLISLLACLTLVLAAGCQVIDDPNSSSGSSGETETVQQGIGESNTGYRLDGQGSGTIPKRNERVTLHLANRVRMNPFDEFMLEDMNGNPIPPNAPARYTQTGSEAARWKSRYLLNNECSTPCDADGNPMTPPEFRSCCQVALQDGKFACTPPQNVDCTSDEAMTQDQRLSVYSSAGVPSFRSDFWVRDQRNPGGIFDGYPGPISEKLLGELVPGVAGQNLIRTAISPSAQTIGLGFVNQPVVPDMCDPEPPVACNRGKCRNSQGEKFCDTEANPECTGTCQGCGGEGSVCKDDQGRPLPCTLPEEPDEDMCNPDNYARRFQLSFAYGSTGLPRPTLMDGIHLKLGAFGDSPFGSTPASDLEFAVHYYEPSAPAQDAQVVVDGQCHELTTRFEPESADPPDPDAGPDAGDYEFSYFGNTYNANVEVTQGCHPYYFSVIDGEGFQQSYPQYGALQARVAQLTDGDGNTIMFPLPNNDECPIWTPDRENANAACLPEVDECDDGETRSCYTGTAQTRGVGACSIGTETCNNGRWSGVCENQQLPASDDTCGDNVDNDCNGIVDDGCGTDSPDGGMNKQDTGVTPDGGGPDGGGPGNDIGLRPGGDDDGSEGCGCRSTGDSIPTAPVAILLLATGFITVRRRAAKHD